MPAGQSEVSAGVSRRELPCYNASTVLVAVANRREFWDFIMYYRTLLTLMAMLLCLSLLLATADAQQGRTIRVRGSGTAAASPNSVSLRGTISADGDEVAKTAESFAEHKSEFEKAFTEKHPGVRLTFAGEKLSDAGGAMFEGGLAVPDADFGGPVEVAEVGNFYTITEEVTLRLEIGSDMEREGITKKLGGLITDAEKSGLHSGGSANAMMAAMGVDMTGGLLSFELDEAGQRALHASANKAAFADARHRAEALAELSGGKLGRVIAVEEVAEKQGESKLESLQMTMMRNMFGLAAGDDSAAGGIDYNGRIKIQREVDVTFELVD